MIFQNNLQLSDPLQDTQTTMEFACYIFTILMACDYSDVIYFAEQHSSEQLIASFIGCLISCFIKILRFMEPLTDNYYTPRKFT
jgi:uncharacterized protein YqgC (DUF456 family)